MGAFQSIRKSETVQFDWNTLKVVPKQWCQYPYNLSIRGMFNNNPDTK